MNNNILNSIYKNTLSIVIFKNKENNYLVTKSFYTNGILGFPIIKNERQFANEGVSNSLEIRENFKKIFKVLEEEFGVQGKLINYLISSKHIFQIEGMLEVCNTISYKVFEIEDYKGKPLPNLKPSGIYSDFSFISKDEINRLFRLNQFDQNSMIYFLEELNNNI